MASGKNLWVATTLFNEGVPILLSLVSLHDLCLFSIALHDGLCVCVFLASE